MLACLRRILRLALVGTCAPFVWALLGSRGREACSSSTAASSCATSSASTWATTATSTSAYHVRTLWRHPFTRPRGALGWTHFSCLAVEVRCLVHHPHVLQAILQILESVLVTGVEAVPPVHLEFSLGHQLRLFDLRLRKLHLGSACVIWLAVRILHVLLVRLVILVLATALRLLVRVGIRLRLVGLLHVSPVLLRYLILHLVDRILF